ncbi:MAG: DMT family transporter, partial [Paracoccus sp. (in: a-proteobacteria)]|uniref:DMT family transporter n=1 Tax=Paracoccus sp. TaxID=267 RepID=UPI00391BC8DD
MASNNLRGAALALLAMGIYATHDVVIKTLGGTYPPLQILFFASLLSFPLVTLILLRDPNPGTLRATNPGWVALRTVCAVIGGMCGFYAFSTTPLAQVYAILFSMPLLITVLSIPLLGEKVGRHRWIAVALGLIGVMIVLRPGTQSLSAGHLAALVAAVTGATAAVIIRRVGGTERPMVLMMWPMLANFVVTGASLSLAYEPMALADMGLSALIAAMG